MTVRVLRYLLLNPKYRWHSPITPGSMPATCHGSVGILQACLSGMIGGCWHCYGTAGRVCVHHPSQIPLSPAPLFLILCV